MAFGAEAAERGSAGTGRLTSAGRGLLNPFPSSGRLGRGRPRGFGLASQDAQAGAGDQMGLEVEGVVDWAVRREETLRLTLGFEPLLLSLPSSDDEV